MKHSRSLRSLSVSSLVSVSRIAIAVFAVVCASSKSFAAPAAKATPKPSVAAKHAPTPIHLTQPVVKEVKFSRSDAKVRPIKQKFMGAKYWIQPNQIVGCCMAYDTIARIETTDGVFVRQDQVKTYDTFNFRKLKPGTYNLYLIHPRYKTPIKLENIKSGNWITYNPS